MKWKTRFTDLVGCEYPILEGAFGGLGNWKLAAAVSEAGALGCITASVSKKPERLREDIRRLRDVTDKPFSVNISVGLCPEPEEMLDVILEEGVPVLETAAYRGDALGKRAKEAGRVWIHKAATVKHCIKAEEQGADAVIIVGLEGIGFKNIEQLPTILCGVLAAKQIKVPVIVAGGIGDGRGLVAALGMGAEAMMMGTVFMAVEESPISKRIKEQMVATSANHPKIKYECLAMPDPKVYEEVMKLRGQIPMEEWLQKLENVMLKQGNWRDMAATMDFQADEVAGHQSMAVEFITGIKSCKQVINEIVQEAEEIINSKFAPMVQG
ncbi:MAG: NAD(P)H-dependent flavin oxidoreductase [Bacillota bacterium]